jgi:ABC-type polysaccharide/polyol phosphate transport system ATPase subunit
VLAVGDENFQQKCFVTFDRFKEEGKTVVLVTHELGLLERFADRVLVLEHGVVHGIGPPDDAIQIYRRDALIA